MFRKFTCVIIVLGILFAITGNSYSQSYEEAIKSRKAVDLQRKQAAVPDSDLLQAGIRFIPPAGWKKAQEKWGYFYDSPGMVANIAVKKAEEMPYLSFLAGLSMMKKTQKAIAEEKINFLGVPCTVFILKKVLDDGQVSQSKQFNWFKDGKAFQILYTALLPYFDTYLKDFEECLSSYEIVEKPGSGLTSYYKAEEYYKKQMYDEAINEVSKFIEVNPKNTAGYISRGATYTAKKDFDRAITDFTKAIELDPKYADAYSNRGFTYGKKGEIDKCIADCSKSIDLNPKHPKYYNNRGVCYDNNKEYDRAIADYNKTIELDAKNAEAYYGRGCAFGKQGRYDEAIADYTKVIELKPVLAAVAYNNRADAYFQKAEYDKAWVDVNSVELLKGKLDLQFIEKLKKASGREK